MVRPTDSDDATPRKANLREAILCAAEDLFSTNGFNAVSVRDIAQAAGERHVYFPSDLEDFARAMRIRESRLPKANHVPVKFAKVETVETYLGA